MLVSVLGLGPVYAENVLPVAAVTTSVQAVSARGIGRTIPVFRSYTVDQGLVQSWVSAIEFDARGFAWIGTENGLSRFDGHHFTNFRNDLKDPSSLQSNSVWDLLRDRDGRLWVVTLRGIDRFNPQNSTFEHVITEARLHALGIKAIYRIIQAENGDFWVVGDTALLRWHDGLADATVYPVNSKKLPAKEVVRIFALAHNEIIVGDYRAGLLRFDASTDRFVPWLTVSDLRGNRRSASIRDIAVLPDTTLWMATEDGLLHVDQDGRVIKHLSTTNTHWLPSGRLNSIIRYRNQLWVSASKTGLYRLTLDGRLIEHIQHVPDAPYTLPEGSLGRLKLGPNEQIWIATSGRGFSIWSPRSERTRRVDFVGRGKGPLSGAVIWSIAQDHLGDIWVGSDGGLDRWNARQRKFHHIDVGKTIISGDPAEVYTLMPQGNTMWAATSAGLVKIDLNSEVRRSYYAKKTSARALAADFIPALYTDANGKLWVAYADGISVFDAATQRFSHLNAKTVPGNPCVLGISALTGTPSGRLYVGAKNGVCVTDINQVKFMALPGLGSIQSPNNSFLTTALMVDGDDLWIGYSGNGLVRYSLSRKKVLAHYDIEHGLPSNNVSSLLKDEYGRLWISSQTGLVILDPAKDTIALLTGLDGLGDSEFNESAYLQLRDGEFAFGTIRGLLLIDASKFRIHHDVSVPEIVDVHSLATGRAFDPRRDLHLSEKNSALRISFSLREYYHPERIKYQYRIIGQGSGWTNIGNRSEIFFGNFDVGRYPLEIRGRDFSNDWSLPARIEIIVMPALWKSPLAVAAYILTGILALLLFMRMRLKQGVERESMLVKVRASESRLRLSLDATEQGVWRWNAVNDEIYRSKQKRLMRMDTDDTSRPLLTHWAQIDPRDRLQVVRAWNAHLFGQSTDYKCHYRFRTDSGEILWLDERGRAETRDKNGMARSIVGTYRNVSEAHATRRNLTLLAQAFEDTNEGVVMIDDQFRVVKANRASEHLIGYTEADLLSKPVAILRSQARPQKDYDAIWAAVAESGKWQGELWLRTVDGEEVPMWLSVSQTRHDDEEAAHFVMVFSDISERKAAEEELRFLANYDTLTQLPNRALLRDRLEHALTNARRMNRPLAVMFLDLDRFKQINDSFGHGVGDKLLINVADKLGACLREEDTIARIGGDEFVILLEHFRTVGAIAAVAEKIRNSMDVPVDLEGYRLRASFSIGVALYPGDGADAEALLKNADTAMYSAKDSGRNQMKFYSPSMNAQALERLTVENELRAAIGTEQLEVWYQPQVGRDGKELVGLEALCRWRHPERGLIGPMNFIPLAEESDLILDLGEDVLLKACNQLHQWQQEYGFTQHISVNLSARQLRLSHIVDILSKNVEACGVKFSDICLEITETAVMEDLGYASQQIDRLRQLGFKIAMDDFGTGYSSLNYLRSIPFDLLKIDYSFVRNLLESETDRLIVKAIVDISNVLEREVLAEGVETEAQRQFLDESGCHLYQGYLFGKPMPAADIEQRYLIRK